jgi:hypothetical protein
VQIYFKEMKKVLWFFLLIGVVLGGDRALAYVLKSKLESSKFRYSRLYTKQAQADILLVGNSRGLTLYQPAIEAATGASSFNLSYNGAPAYLLEALTLDYLDLYPAPKTAVIDITLADRPNNSLVAGFAAYLPYSQRIAKILKDSLTDEYYGAQVTHLYRFNSEVYHRTLFYSSKSDTDWLNTHTLSAEAAADPNAAPYPLDIHPQLVSSLINMVKTLQSKGTQVQLVIAPYAPNYAQKVTNLDQLKSTIEGGTGLTVRDYRSLLTDHRDFSDYMHPNLTGAQKFVGKMREDGVFQ